MYSKHNHPVTFNVVKTKPQKQEERQVKVQYLANVRLPMLHGGFFNHTFDSSAVFSVPGDEFSVSDAKATLESLFIRKFRARRIRWAKFEVIAID